MKKILIYVIKFYQKTISPDHGYFRFMFPNGYCRFYPSCSEYSIQVLVKYGLIKGLSKSIYRILRCNPWNKGGYDPVDKN